MRVAKKKTRRKIELVPVEPDSNRELKRLMSILKRNLPELQMKYKIKTIGIFGSYVRGEQRKRSDLDILVEFDEGHSMTLFKFIELEHYLSDLLDVKVDLVMKNSLKPRIGRHILNKDTPSLKPLIVQMIEQESKEESDK